MNDSVLETVQSAISAYDVIIAHLMGISLLHLYGVLAHTFMNNFELDMFRPPFWVMTSYLA
jgi:hypothetical protein